MWRDPPPTFPYPRTTIRTAPGIAIPPTARALGALPVFAFLTLPAAGAILLRVGFRPAFLLAGSLGVLAAGAGFVVSWALELPTGATMVAVAALLAAPGAIARLARG